MSRQKKQTIKLELNRLTAEVLLQALRHSNWREVQSAVKETLEYNPGSEIEEALRCLESQVSHQITWSLF